MIYHQYQLSIRSYNWTVPLEKMPCCCRCMREEHVAKSFTALLTCNIKARQHGNGQENQTDMARIIIPTYCIPSIMLEFVFFRSQNAPKTIISPQSPSQDSKEKQVPVPFVDSWISMC